MTELEPLDVPGASVSRAEATGHVPEFLVRNGIGEGQLTKKYEQPWHRQAAYFIASGMPAGEVARACDVTSQTISILIRTPWFQKIVTTLMSEQGRDVMDMVKGEALNSLMTLVEIRDDIKVPSSVRKAAAKDIFEFAQGKAIQRIESNSVIHSSDPVAEERRLREENERLSGASAPVASSREG